MAHGRAIVDGLVWRVPAYLLVAAVLVRNLPVVSW